MGRPNDGTDFWYIADGGTTTEYALSDNTGGTYANSIFTTKGAKKVVLDAIVILNNPAVTVVADTMAVRNAGDSADLFTIKLAASAAEDRRYDFGPDGIPCGTGFGLKTATGVNAAWTLLVMGHIEA